MAEALTRKQIIQAVWNKFKAIIGNHDISGMGDGTVTGALAGLNGNYKKQYVQGGLVTTSNLNNYFRSAHITFEIPYKTGTKPVVVASVRNYQNTNIDSRLTVLFKNESFVCC